MIVALIDNLQLAEPALLIIVVAPLLVAAALAFEVFRPVAAKIAPWMALPAVLLSVLVSPGHAETLEWLLLGTRLSYDEIGRIFLFFTGWIWLLAGLFARRSVDQRGRSAFWAFYLLSLSGNLGVTLARDLPGFFFFFSLMGFASYGLVLHRRDEQAVRAARVYIVLLVVGEGLLYAGAVMAAMEATSWEAAAIAEAIGRSPRGNLIAALFFAGFATKAGVVPLHISLPPAYDAAPASAGAVLSGTMSKAGVLGWMLFLPVGEGAMLDVGMLFLLAGLGSVYYGVVVGLMQRTPKAILAYSSISQIGFMTLLIGVGLQSARMWPAALVATAIYALHHGLNKGALFLGVSICQEKLTGRWTRGLALAGLLLPSLALAGAPLTSGAVAKHALKESLAIEELAVGSWFETLVALGAIGTAVLLARFVIMVWPPKEQAHGDTQDGLEPALWIPWALLIASVVAAPWLFPWESMQQSAAETLTWSSVWSEVWPLAVAAALVAVVMFVADRMSWLSRLRLPAGDLLVPLGHVTLTALHATERVLRWIEARGAWLKATVIDLVTRPMGLASRTRQAEAAITAWHVGATLAVILAVVITALAGLL